MRLTILGGSAAGGNIGAGCSGYFLQTTSTTLVFDLGPGTLLELRRHCNYRELNAIVISHMHLDHVLDLCALRFALAYNPLRPESRIPLWLPPDGTKALNRIAAGFADDNEVDAFFNDVFEIHEYVAGESLAIGDLTIDFAPTVHYIPCWAMRFRTESRGSLGYTGDTGPAANLQTFFRDCQVIVSEATLLKPRDEPFESRGHLTAAEAGQLATDSGATTLIMSHLWQEHGFDQLQQRAETTFDGRLVIAHPGTVVEW